MATPLSSLWEADLGDPQFVRYCDDVSMERGKPWRTVPGRCSSEDESPAARRRFLERNLGGTAKWYTFRITCVLIGLGIAALVNEWIALGMVLLGIGTITTVVVLLWRP